MFDPTNRTTDATHPALWSRLRARLQPCRNSLPIEGALASEGLSGSEPESVPQRLKPHSISRIYGTAKAVPLSKTRTQRVKPHFLPHRFRFRQTALVFSLAVIMLGAGDTTEKRFERIGHNMMCACSCGQILLECNHVGCPDSDRMRKELHDQVAAPGVGSNGSTPSSGGLISSTFGAGGSDKQVLDWFVEKYGAMVLAAPLRGGFDDVAWITPIALFLAAILGTAAIIRIWKARTAQRIPLKIKGMSVASTDELRERIRRETLY